MTAEQRRDLELRSALTRLHLAVEMLAMQRPEECKELLTAKQGVLDAVRTGLYDYQKKNVDAVRNHK